MSGVHESQKSRPARTGAAAPRGRRGTPGRAIRDLQAALDSERQERRRLEQALRDSEALLAHAGRLTALGEMSAMVAHEINQPLAAIAANAACGRHWLDGATLDIGEAREAVAAVIEDCARAAAIVGRMRAMARREAPARAPVDLNAVLRDAVALLGGRLAGDAITVETALAGDLPVLAGDAVQLHQVAVNLIQNAADALAAVSGRQRVLHIATRRARHGVVLRVSDNGVGFGGVGFGDADPDRVFDAFVSGKRDGLGLGLAICRSIVDAHGGTITAARRAPSGATFEIFLPRNLSPGQEPSP